MVLQLPAFNSFSFSQDPFIPFGFRALSIPQCSYWHGHWISESAYSGYQNSGNGEMEIQLLIDLRSPEVNNTHDLSNCPPPPNLFHGRPSSGFVHWPSSEHKGYRIMTKSWCSFFLSCYLCFEAWYGMPIPCKVLYQVALQETGREEQVSQPTLERL